MKNILFSVKLQIKALSKKLVQNKFLLFFRLRIYSGPPSDLFFSLRFKKIVRLLKKKSLASRNLILDKVRSVFWPRVHRGKILNDLQHINPLVKKTMFFIVIIISNLCLSKNYFVWTSGLISSWVYILHQHQTFNKKYFKETLNLKPLHQNVM